jgi:FlaA1/EpsC-like NDP-sugar epimerase
MAIVFTGVRPGEKLYEELLTAEEGTDTTTHEKIFIARMNNTFAGSDQDLALQRLWDIAQDGDRKRIIAQLRSLVPTYKAHEDS